MILLILLCSPILCGAQLGLVCSKGSEFTTSLLLRVIDGNRDFFRSYSPLKIPGLEENFGLARLYNCSFAGLENTNFSKPVDVVCDGRGPTNRVELGLYVELREGRIICELALGLAPTLAAHTMVVIQFDEMSLFVALEVPRNKQSRIRVRASQLNVTSIRGQKVILTGLEPITSILTQAATFGLRITPFITRAFLTEFLKIEVPKIIARVKLPF